MHIKNFEIIIVGAGPCGLAAAQFLNKNGVDDFVIVTGDSRHSDRMVRLNGNLFDDISSVASYGFGGNKDLWGGRVTFDRSALEMTYVTQECIDFVQEQIFMCDIEKLSADSDEVWLNRANLSHLNFLRDKSIRAYVQEIQTSNLKNYVILHDGSKLSANKIIICAGAFETTRLVSSIHKIDNLKYFGHISGIYDKELKIRRQKHQFRYQYNALTKDYIYKNPNTNAVYSIVNQDFSSNNTFLTALIAILVKSKVMSLFLRNPILEKSLIEKFKWNNVLQGLLSFGLGDVLDAFHLIYQRVVLGRRLPVRLLRNATNAYRIHVQIPSTDYTNSHVEVGLNGMMDVSWSLPDERLMYLSETVKADLAKIGIQELEIDEIKVPLANSKDGYHSFNLLPVDSKGDDTSRVVTSELTLKGFPNIAVGTTALISSKNLHFPTLMGVLLAVQSAMNLLKSN